MNDPLLKAIELPLGAEEEAELTRRFSEAYCRAETTATEPAFERTQQKISLHLEHLDRLTRRHVALLQASVPIA
jgi:hypothetical protein